MFCIQVRYKIGPGKVQSRLSAVVPGDVVYIARARDWGQTNYAQAARAAVGKPKDKLYRWCLVFKEETWGMSLLGSVAKVPFECDWTNEDVYLHLSKEIKKAKANVLAVGEVVTNYPANRHDNRAVVLLRGKSVHWSGM